MHVPAFAHRLCVLVAICACLTSAGLATAETPAGSNVDSRVVVGLRAPADGVQGFLPDGWTSVAFPAGPFQGANLLLVFIDSLVQRDAEGKPLSPASRRALALVSLGKEADGADVRLFVLRIYTTTPEADPYGVNAAADISRRTAVEGPANGGRQRIDAWQVGPAAGGTLGFELSYTTGGRNWSPGEAFPHSARNPDFSRIYRFQQLADLVVSVPMGKPASGAFSLSSSVDELAAILDGSEEILAVIDVPVYVREISLP